jgi:hypothetical protein
MGVRSPPAEANSDLGGDAVLRVLLCNPICVQDTAEHGFGFQKAGAAG